MQERADADAPSPKRACVGRPIADTLVAADTLPMPRPALRASQASSNASELVFQMTDWYVPEADREWTSRLDRDGDAPDYQIVMFGVTEAGHSVCARVNDFKPYFYLRLPDTQWRNKGDAAIRAAIAKLRVHLLEGRYTGAYYDAATKKVKQNAYASRIVPPRLAEHLTGPDCGLQLVKRKDFWGFTNAAEFPFVKITVRSLALYNALKRYFEHDAALAAGYKLYESNIDPFLRFIHSRKLQPCGWARLPAGHYQPVDEEFSRAQINVDVSFDMVKPVDISRIAPLLIASFDIECTSSHGDFPVATKDYRKLAQDLVAAATAAGARPSREDARAWLGAAFAAFLGGGSAAAAPAHIHPVYLKTPPAAAELRACLDRLAGEVLPALELVARLAPGGDAEEDGGASDDEDAAPKGTVLQQRARYENEALDALNAQLLKAYPLEGDPIIQVGTTVSVYGSDAIVYRHVATLGSCAPIEGARVDTYETEADMLLGWKRVFGELDPDIVIGYNIFGFDMDYLWTRAKENGVADAFGAGLGRIFARQLSAIKEQRLASSALGDNVLKYFHTDGIVSVDLLKVMQRDHKLDSYTLDNVAAHFLGDRKADLSPNDIFRKFGGSAADRAEIGRYCLQDCALVNRLLHKLKVLENNMGMGNVCSVPLSYLFMRGQGIKIFSLVAKACRASGTLIPVVKPPRHYGEEVDAAPDEVGYEGAVVLEPQEGMYLE